MMWVAWSALVVAGLVVWAAVESILAHHQKH